MHADRPRASSRTPCVSFAAGLALAPVLAFAQAASPFMTGATALQSNILAWLTPIAIILVMALGAMAMANRIVENCGNTLILRCAGSEHGGTSQFASRLIGEREVLRTSISRSQRPFELLPVINRSENSGVEAAVMASEIEQLPDLAGYLKLASRREWLQVRLSRPTPEREVQCRPPGNPEVAREAGACADVARHAPTGFGLE